MRLSSAELAALRASLAGEDYRRAFLFGSRTDDAGRAEFGPELLRLRACLARRRYRQARRRDEADRSRPLHKAAPVWVAEVLSPSTSADDRGQEFARCRNLPVLREYLLIDTERLAVDLFRRDDSGHWVLYPTVAGEVVDLSSIGMSLPIEALYEEVALEPGLNASAPSAPRD